MFFLLGAEVGGEEFWEILKSETLRYKDPRISIQPVFKPRTGDLGEVDGVAGEERGVVGQGDVFR